jgi:hypothetical protein
MPIPHHILKILKNVFHDSFEHTGLGDIQCMFEEKDKYIYFSFSSKDQTIDFTSPAFVAAFQSALNTLWKLGILKPCYLQVREVTQMGRPMAAAESVTVNNSREVRYVLAEDGLFFFDHATDLATKDHLITADTTITGQIKKMPNVTKEVIERLSIDQFMRIVRLTGHCPYPGLKLENKKTSSDDVHSVNQITGQMSIWLFSYYGFVNKIVWKMLKRSSWRSIRDFTQELEGNKREEYVGQFDKNREDIEFAIPTKEGIKFASFNKGQLICKDPPHEITENNFERALVGKVIMTIVGDYVNQKWRNRLVQVGVERLIARVANTFPPYLSGLLDASEAGLPLPPSMKLIFSQLVERPLSPIDFRHGCFSLDEKALWIVHTSLYSDKEEKAHDREEKTCGLKVMLSKVTSNIHRGEIRRKMFGLREESWLRGGVTPLQFLRYTGNLRMYLPNTNEFVSAKNLLAIIDTYNVTGDMPPLPETGIVDLEQMGPYLAREAQYTEVAGNTEDRKESKRVARFPNKSTSSGPSVYSPSPLPSSALTTPFPPHILKILENVFHGFLEKEGLRDIRCEFRVEGQGIRFSFSFYEDPPFDYHEAFVTSYQKALEVLWRISILKPCYLEVSEDKQMGHPMAVAKSVTVNNRAEVRYVLAADGLFFFDHTIATATENNLITNNSEIIKQLKEMVNIEVKLHILTNVELMRIVRLTGHCPYPGLELENTKTTSGGDVYSIKKITGLMSFWLFSWYGFVNQIVWDMLTRVGKQTVEELTTRLNGKYKTMVASKEGTEFVIPTKSGIKIAGFQNGNLFFKDCPQEINANNLEGTLAGKTIVVPTNTGYACIEPEKLITRVANTFPPYLVGLVLHGNEAEAMDLLKRSRSNARGLCFRVSGRNLWHSYTSADSGKKEDQTCGLEMIEYKPDNLSDDKASGEWKRRVFGRVEDQNLRWGFTPLQILYYAPGMRVYIPHAGNYECGMDMLRIIDIFSITKSMPPLDTAQNVNPKQMGPFVELEQQYTQMGLDPGDNKKNKSVGITFPQLNLSGINNPYSSVMPLSEQKLIMKFIGYDKLQGVSSGSGKNKELIIVCEKTSKESLERAGWLKQLKGIVAKKLKRTQEENDFWQIKQQESDIHIIFKPPISQGLLKKAKAKKRVTLAPPTNSSGHPWSRQYLLTKKAELEKAYNQSLFELGSMAEQWKKMPEEMQKALTPVYYNITQRQAKLKKEYYHVLNLIEQSTQGSVALSTLSTLSDAHISYK